MNLYPPFIIYFIYLYISIYLYIFKRLESLPSPIQAQEPSVPCLHHGALLTSHCKFIEIDRFHWFSLCIFWDIVQRTQRSINEATYRLGMSWNTGFLKLTISADFDWVFWDILSNLCNIQIRNLLKYKFLIRLKSCWILFSLVLVSEPGRNNHNLLRSK